MWGTIYCLAFLYVTQRATSHVVAVTGITVGTCKRRLWPLGWQQGWQAALTLPVSHKAILQGTLTQ